MSPYYKYTFVSPEPLLALISEELKSYLDTGAIDSAIWSIYIDKCLRKLGRGMLQITPVILELANYSARLPDNFDSVREAWLCTNTTDSHKLPGADYQQVTSCSTSTLLSNNYSYCTPCDNCNTPDVIKAVYKTTHEAFAYYNKEYLLKPGNLNAISSCNVNSPNIGAGSPDTFDIKANKFLTNFVTGTVYLLYYSKNYDEQSGYQLIPDNYRIQEYIELFIKQKVFEQLSNQVTDETYNQIQQKSQYYKQLSDEAYIMADIEGKKETVYDKRRKIIRERQRNNKYTIK